jgi:adenylate cyclase
LYGSLLKSGWKMVRESALASIVDWLVAGAPPPRSLESLIEELATRLRKAELPIDSANVNIFNIHPIFPGTAVVWTSKRGVRRKTYSHEFMASATYRNTPIFNCINMRRMLRYRFDSSDPETESDTRITYLKAGYTDLLLLPLFDSDGTINKAVLFGTKSQGGFGQDEVASLRRLQSPLARLVETFSDKMEKATALSTYVGKNISNKVLKGHIARGQGEAIPAVLLFVDLVGFTAFSNAHPSAEVVKTLNDFYEIVHEAVLAGNGEILKFIGDGALVIFPVPDDPTAQRSVAQDALNSIADARLACLNRDDGESFAFRASLHIGEVFYGNIGSKERLDFTAIGPAVNLASRLLDEASELNAVTVCSEDFSKLLDPSQATEVKRPLKGFDETVSVFVLE